MRILYCIDYEECKYVSKISDIWIFAEDSKLDDAKLCFLDSCGITFVSSKMKYNVAVYYLNEIFRNGYLDLSDTIFESEDDE